MCRLGVLNGVMACVMKAESDGGGVFTSPDDGDDDDVHVVFTIGAESVTTLLLNLHEH